MPESKNIYDPSYVSALFEEMSATYGVVNLLTSFGVTMLWRGYCLKQVPNHEVLTCCDLMSGMGELIPDIIRKFPSLRGITALDLCPQMSNKIKTNNTEYGFHIKVLQENVFNSSLSTDSFDCVVSSFGLKTFSPEQQRELAKVVNRILKPGGVFAFIEISLPRVILARAPFFFYLKYIVPFIGRILMGNPDNYRMLSVYTKAFNDSKHFYSCLKEIGLEVQYLSHFMGCCTGVAGRKL